MAFLPAIAAIATIAAAGTSIGETLANQPGSPPKAPTTPTTPTTLSTAPDQAQLNAIKEAVGQQTPNVLSATSGLASPDYVQQMIQLLSGTAGTPGSSGAARSSVASAFGLPSSGGPIGNIGSTTNFNPAGAGTSTGPSSNPNDPINLSDFVNRFAFAG